MLNCYLEKALCTRLRWVSVIISVVETVFYSTSFVVTLKNVIEIRELSSLWKNTNRIHTVLLVIHLWSSVLGVVLLAGAIKKNCSCVKIHLLGNGVAWVLLPYWWLKAIVNLKYTNSFIEPCIRHTNGIILFIFMHAILAVPWLFVLFYFKELKQDLYAVVLRGDVKKERSTSWKYLKRISSKFKSVDVRQAESTNNASAS